MRRRLMIGVLAATMIAGTGVLPAAAATESGDITCMNGARRGVAGEQQRFADTLTLRLGGTIVYQSSNVFRGSYTAASGGTSTWSGTSASLLFSGTGGYCQPL